MKKRIFALSLVLAAGTRAFGGGDEKDLMARMGFSKEEIAKSDRLHPIFTSPTNAEPAATVTNAADEAEADAKDAEENAKFDETAAKKSLEDAATDAKITSDPAMLMELAKAEYTAAVALAKLHKITMVQTRHADQLAQCSPEFRMQELDKFLQASSEAKSTSDYVALLRARAAQLASASKH